VTRGTVIARRELLRLGRAALAWPLILTAIRSRADPLGETLAELEQRTREYQESLGRLASVLEEALARATAAADRARWLHAEGLIARGDVEEAARAVTEAERRLGETRRQLTDSEAVMTEARALRQLAALPPVPPGAERSTPEVLEYHGVSTWTLTQVASLEQFFSGRFGRPLPVSAIGQTALHDRLGFDHRNAVDVAVHPDSTEGRVLLDYLRLRGIPFLAFPGPVAGASTGAHVHVGAPSPRTG
jgi:hypothetical protein